MELRHIRYFVAVADSLNFGRAAATLRIAQPSLSHQIRQLEGELQAKLLARTTRRVQLTDAGRLFLEEAREILAHADRAAVVARRASRSELGTLRIGCAHWMDDARIMASIRSFQERNPAVHFNLQTLSVPLQLAALRDERLDVGFVRPPISDPSLASALLSSEPFVVAFSAKHRFRKRYRISASMLADEPFILLPRVTVPDFHDLVLRFCRDAGFVPNLAHEIDQPQRLLALIAIGAGISLVPASVRVTRPRGVMFRRLTPSPRILKIALAWRRDTAAALVDGFVQAVRPLWPGE